jgi:hypothetical protein
MPKFVIEREVPGAGNLSDAQLREISQKSVSVLKGMGPEITLRGECGGQIGCGAIRLAATQTGRGGHWLADGPGAWLRAVVWPEFDSSRLLRLELFDA